MKKKVTFSNPECTVYIYSKKEKKNKFIINSFITYPIINLLQYNLKDIF